MNLSPAYQSLCELWEQPPSFCNYLQDEVILSSKSCQTISVNDFSLLWFTSTRRGTNPVLQLPLHSVSLGQRQRTWGQRVAAPLSGALGAGSTGSSRYSPRRWQLCKVRQNRAGGEHPVDYSNLSRGRCRLLPPRFSGAVLPHQCGSCVKNEPHFPG